MNINAIYYYHLLIIHNFSRIKSDYPNPVLKSLPNEIEICGQLQNIKSGFTELSRPGFSKTLVLV